MLDEAPSRLLFSPVRGEKLLRNRLLAHPKALRDFQNRQPFIAQSHGLAVLRSGTPKEDRYQLQRCLEISRVTPLGEDTHSPHRS